MSLQYSTICTCSTCGISFKYEDAAIKKQNIYGKSVDIKVCPNCNRQTFTMDKDLKWFFKRELQDN